MRKTFCLTIIKGNVHSELFPLPRQECCRYNLNAALGPGEASVVSGRRHRANAQTLQNQFVLGVETGNPGNGSMRHPLRRCPPPPIYTMSSDRCSVFKKLHCICLPPFTAFHSTSAQRFAVFHSNGATLFAHLNARYQVRCCSPWPLYAEQIGMTPTVAFAS